MFLIGLGANGLVGSMKPSQISAAAPESGGASAAQRTSSGAGSAASSGGAQTNSSPPSTVLLIGSDIRPGDRYARSDVLIVVHLDAAKHRIEMMSVPRDTRVNIPGHGWQKINAAYAFGGDPLATQMVSKLLGVPIHYYMETNFSGMQKIIDALGGVTVDVPVAMHYNTKQGVHINLSKGKQHLSGAQVVQFVRYREFATGDIRRESDQQLILKDLYNQVFSLGTVLRLPVLVPELARDVKTNLSVGSMLAAVNLLRQSHGGGIISETCPGGFLNFTHPAASYWDVLPSDAQAAWAALLQGKRTPTFDPKAAANAKALGGAPKL